MEPTTDYGLADVESDALFNLLPHIVRAADPGAIKTIFSAMAEERNFIVGKIRELPRLQDPYKAGSFTPEQFDEDVDLYNELKALRKISTLTPGQAARKERLISLLPKTLRAEEFENAALNFLSKSVGAKSYGQYQVAAVRELVATAILRHQFKGTHTSVYAIGRILGFIDLKLTELWCRYVLKYPADPRAIKNESDFAPFPEEFPYWPLNGVYNGTVTSLTPRDNGLNSPTFVDESFQYPLADSSYDPTVIDDGGFTYTVLFERTSEAVTSPIHYNRVINGKNPFGNFTETVVRRLKPAIYFISGGSTYERGYVSIPSVGGDPYTFEALTLGEWSNGVEIRVFTNPDATQRVEISGPQSKIKFKSSFYDLVMAADAQIFPALFPSVPVEANNGASALDLDYNPQTFNILEVQNSRLGPLFPSIKIDGDAPSKNSYIRIEGTDSSLDGEWYVAARLDADTFAISSKGNYAFDWAGGGNLTYGREAGDFPWTGASNGEAFIADPETHYQMNLTVYNEVLSSLRDMLADTTPVTREIRKETFGYLLRDSMLYAPVITIPEVILESESGKKFSVYVTSANQIVWEEVESGTPVTVQQVDRENGNTYTWGISETGEFRLIPFTNPSNEPLVESIVFLNGEKGVSAFLFVQGSRLMSSLDSPEQVVDAIHGDGTINESILAEDYRNYVETALAGAAVYMSEDAVSEDKPGDNFAFQTSPEDSVSAIRTMNGKLGSHLTFSSESDHHYDVEGNFIGGDPRSRECGIVSNGIEPPVSGEDEAFVNGLTYDYPVEFMNYHGVAVWRNRTTNEAFSATYTYACANDNPLAGATRQTTSLATHDGPISSTTVDGATPVTSQGLGVTPNGQTFDPSFEPVMEWFPYSEKTQRGFNFSVTLTNNGGKCAFSVPSWMSISVGQRVRIVGTTDYNGSASVTELVGDGDVIQVTLSTDFSATEQSGNIFTETAILQSWEEEDITCLIEAVESPPLYQGTSTYRIVSYSPNDPDEITLLETGTVGTGGVDTTVSNPRGKIIAIEINGQDPLVCRVERSRTTGRLFSDAWTGDLMVAGGKDDIAVTLTADGESWEDIGDGIDSTDPINSKRWWRGGNWS